MVQTKASLTTKNRCSPAYLHDHNIIGKISVSVQYDNEMLSLDLQVVEGDGPFLMGRDWLSKLIPNLSVFMEETQSDKGVE